MKLILTHGRPYPFPEGFDIEAEGYDPLDYTVEIRGVTHFEWLDTVTVEFKGFGAYQCALEQTGWRPWLDCVLVDCVLEADTSRPDGYDHPAIIVKDKAYCGFMLVDE